MFTVVMSIFELLVALVRSWRIPSFRAALVLAVVILLTGTVFFHKVEGWTWVDSFYFSATTVSTVGFGDLTPKTDTGKIFTVIYMFIGIGVFVLLFSQLAKSILKIEEDDKR